jgi:hypothetical protein
LPRYRSFDRAVRAILIHFSNSQATYLATVIALPRYHQSIFAKQRKLDCFVARLLAKTLSQTHVRASRRDAPEPLPESYAPRKQRAWGMPDAQWHPQPRVQKTAITHTSIHSEAPKHPAFPTQWF